MKRLQIFIVAIFVCISVTAQDKTYHGDGPDDVLQYIPYASVFAMKGLGVESASSWKRLAVNAVASYVVMAGTSWALKHSVNERRPDGSDNRSFPSGHAAVAFSGATVLHKEFGHVSPWISVAGYTIATATAIDRVARNRHHWYDVAAGAAIGVLATEFGYWIGDKITGEHSRYSVGVTQDGLSMVIRL